LRDFCIGWCGKPTQIAGKCTLGEFLEYLEFFQEAEGVLCEDGEDDDVAEALGPRDVSGEELSNAVQMMTIHGAKGLEFQHVFVLRIVTSSLPRTYREPLVEFPQALRSPDTVPESDPKSLFNEEERRLFYVAITRAKDHLHLYGKAGPGKDLVPSKFLRDLTKKQKAELAGAVEHRVLQTPLILSRLHAAAEPLPVLAQWLQLPPRPDARLCDLSASAIEQYKRCPLAYKLGRDWNIPEAPMAHMQFGSAMHLALKAYFDSVSVGRPLGEDAVVACFLDEFGKAKIEEQLQRDLYEKKGREELVRLLSSELATPEGKILESERRFKIQVGDAAVVGRMDRLDHLAGDEVAIVDYKTGRAKSQQDADDSLQLSIYALAAKRLGMKPGPLVFINLDNGVAVASQRSAEQIIATENQIIAVAQKIAGGEFAPKPDKLCRNCSYFSICPAQEVKIANGNGRNDTKVN
jgi:ATP-dependent exoDNAse (exonuclease V) beta subunit